MAALGTLRQVTLSFLLQRLNWPVPMVRWRAAKQIRNLLNDPSTRGPMTEAFLAFLAKCGIESQVCSLLTIIFLVEANARPSYDEITPCITHSSILSDYLLERIYGPRSALGNYRSAGMAPADFELDDYFAKYQMANVAPVFSSTLRRLQNETGRPFLRQWGYEWHALQEELGIAKTHYPYYFDALDGIRSGITGNYMQQQTELYRSAYLRTMVIAVAAWGMQLKEAVFHSIEHLPAVGGLFDVEPQERPQWLGDFPNRCFKGPSNLKNIAQESLRDFREGSKRCVSLFVPFDREVCEFGHLSLSAQLVTGDFVLAPNQTLHNGSDWQICMDTLTADDVLYPKTMDNAVVHGAVGTAVPICGDLFPIPHGYWQSDYYSAGLSLPFSFHLPEERSIKIHDGVIDVASGKIEVAQTRVWHDAWTDHRPRDGQTRVGVAAMLESEILDDLERMHGLKLAWFLQTRTWKRENDYGNYNMNEVNAFFCDQ